MREPITPTKHGSPTVVGTPFDQHERLAKLAEKPRMDHQASQKRPEFVEMHCSDFENRVFETDTELHPQR